MCPDGHCSKEGRDAPESPAGGTIKSLQCVPRPRTSCYCRAVVPTGCKLPIQAKGGGGHRQTQKHACPPGPGLSVVQTDLPKGGGLWPFVLLGLPVSVADELECPRVQTGD